MTVLSRRSFLKRTGALGGGVVAAGPLGMLSARTAGAAPPPASAGYGPLVPKGDLALPAEFNYQVISFQGMPQREGVPPTPGIFDGMGAFPDAGGGLHGEGRRTILIRNHENRERRNETKVVTGSDFEYDESANGGCTKLVVERRTIGHDADTGLPAYEFEVVDSFNIIGGTSTNCAGGELPFKAWLTCEEVVKRQPNGKKHGYNFEVDAMADGPVVAVPIPQMGRFVHEATCWLAGILYETEDRAVDADGIGAAFYRYVPDQRVGQAGALAETTGRLEALRVVGAPRFDTDAHTAVGVPLAVDWVPIPEPDHEDDADNSRSRTPGATPTRVQAYDAGAAVFDRCEGIWTTGTGGGGKVFFDATAGGPAQLGQIWEYDPGRETLTLVYVSTNAAALQNPDNVTIVPSTGDVFLCEDSPGTDFIRGLTQDGEIYDFAETRTNLTEFCGACFDPDGKVLYVNQQGTRPGATPTTRAVTYAIYGPFERRAGANNRNFGPGPAVAGH